MELLVVIGIIALLVSMLLPALNKARRSAQQVACLSNVRQLATSVILYAGASNGWLPYEDWSGGQDTGAWFMRVAKVNRFNLSTKDRIGTFWTCPIAVGGGDSRAAEATHDTGDLLYSNSCHYAINKYLRGQRGGGPGGWDVNWQPVKLARSKSTALLADAPVGYHDYFKAWLFRTTFNHRYGSYGWDQDAPWPVLRPEDSVADAGKVKQRHNRGISVAFADGHAESLPVLPQSMVVPTWRNP